MEQNNNIISIKNIINELNLKQKQLQEVIQEYNKKIEEIQQQINDIIIPQKIDNINIDDLTEEKLNELLSKYNIPKEEYLKSFNSLKLENFKKFFPSNYEIETEKINEVIETINKFIVQNNNQIEIQKNKQEKLTKELETIQLEKKEKTSELERNTTILNFYNKFLEYLKLEKLNLDKITEIKEFILETKFLTNDDKAILIQIICKNIVSNLNIKISKENNEIITFEETLEDLEEELSKDLQELNTTNSKEISSTRNEIIAEINEYLKKYPYYENALFSIEDIKTGINNLKECDIEYITYLISTCIINIRNLDKTDTEVEEYIKYFTILKTTLKNKEQNNQRFIELLEAKESLEKARINFNNYYGKNYNNLTNDQKEKCLETNKKISNYLNNLEELLNKESIINEEKYIELKNEYNNIILIIQKFYNEIERKNFKIETIKGFVIPEKSNNEESCVISDLITKPLIDTSAQATNSNWKEQYSNLIDDLVYSAVPSVLESSESSVSNNSQKFDDSVYFDTNRKESTGMHRYRPSRLSMVRFVEKKIVLNPNTEIFDQVKNIILKNLPNISINDSEPFTLFINFSNSVKKDDTNVYDVAIKRLRNSQLMRMFHVDGRYKKNKGEPTGKIKDSLTDKELKILEAYISRTCEEYQTLNTEHNFNIKFIEGSTKKKGVKYE